MKIKLQVIDAKTGDVLEELGDCLTDSPTRAVQMYHDEEKWEEKGYCADIKYTIIEEA